MCRFFAALLVILAVAAGVLLYRTVMPATSRQTAAPSPVPAATSPTAAAESRDAVRSFDQKIDSVSEAISGGGKKKVSLTLTEQEVTAKIRESLAPAGSGALRDVAVRLGDGKATVYATASLNGMDLPLEGDLRLTANGGRLNVEVTSLKAGSMGLPESLQTQILEQVKRSAGLTDLGSIDVGFDVQKVLIVPGQIQLEGETRF